MSELVDRLGPHWEGTRSYKRGDDIAVDATGQVYLVREGVAAVGHQMVEESAQGKPPRRLAVILRGPGSWVGADGVFLAQKDPKVGMFLKAVADGTKVSWIPAKRLNTLLGRELSAYREEAVELLTCSLAQTYRDVQEVIGTSAYSTSEQKVERVIRAVAEHAGMPHKLGTAVDMPGPLLEILTGVGKMTVLKSLGALMNEGTVAKVGKITYVIR